MFEIGELFSSSAQMWSLFFCAVLIGMSKTGMQGINTVSIPLMAIAFGAKPSTGIILPMLCFADLIAVCYYRRQASWRIVLKLLPPAVVGFFAAIFVDSFVPEDEFRILIAFSIAIGLVVMFWTERGGGKAARGNIADKWWYAQSFGVMGGFTTMIGNAAGAVMSVYLLSARLPKLIFVGTNAWFFLMVNYMKLPLQAFVWNNLDAHSLAVGACGIPFILAGAVFGIWFVKKLPERYYRIFIIATTIISTACMFVEF